MATLDPGVTGRRRKARPQPEPLTLSVPEAGRRYFGLSKKGSYDAARRGEIPTIRVGKLMKVPVRAMERMLDEAGRNATLKRSGPTRRPSRPLMPSPQPFAEGQTRSLKRMTYKSKAASSATFSVHAWKDLHNLPIIFLVIDENGNERGRFVSERDAIAAAKQFRAAQRKALAAAKKLAKAEAQQQLATEKEAA